MLSVSLGQCLAPRRRLTIVEKSRSPSSRVPSSGRSLNTQNFHQKCLLAPTSSEIARIAVRTTRPLSLSRFLNWSADKRRIGVHSLVPEVLD